MAKKILIVTKNQFGYQTDYYKYIYYLKNDYDITYYSFDNDEKKVHEKGINLIYTKSKGSYLKRAYLFFLNLIKLIQNGHFDLIMIKNFDYCFILKIFFTKKKFILDLRSSAIGSKKLKRSYHNFLIRLNLLFFSNITVISEGLAKKLHLNNYRIVPLGADVISETNKDFQSFSLIYIGTFSNRHIEKTIQGVKTFLDNNPEIKPFEYHIFGKGKPNEEKLINEYINKFKLTDNVLFHGFKRHEEIKEYFDTCNLGVSYVPIKDYFNHQPPTKTFEYLLSGMACIATETFENKKIITTENGVLCSDNSESFAKALEKIYKNRYQYNSNIIRSTVANHKWEKIIHNTLLEFINKLI